LCGITCEPTGSDRQVGVGNLQPEPGVRMSNLGWWVQMSVSLVV
jgi:hypothetical protein